MRPPCDVCGETGPTYQTWSHMLCQGCSDDVWAVLPTAGEIMTACGITDEMPLELRIKVTSAEYLRRMRGWVAKQRAASKLKPEVRP